MTFPNFWRHIGTGLAVVAKGSASAALWASTHPEVVTTVASIVGHPEIGVVINTAGGIITTTVTHPSVTDH